MQIVIDIPEEIYKASQIIDVKHEDVVQIPLEVIAHGITLDKIRAEIIKQFEGCYLEEDMTDERKAEHKAYKNVLQIIDKYRE